MSPCSQLQNIGHRSVDFPRRTVNKHAADQHREGEQFEIMTCIAFADIRASFCIQDHQAPEVMT